MINPFSNIFLLTLSLLPFAACNRGSDRKVDISTIVNNDSIPASIKQLVRSVADNDSVQFAKLVSYPLSRPYPLHDLNTPEDLKCYYSTLVDDSLKSVIINSTAANWEEYGWRGWSLDRGEYLWIDDNVYDIPYISQTERNMLDSLRNAEIMSLHESLRKGWQPVSTLIADDKSGIYRIDSTKTKDNHLVYRLCGFESGTDLNGKPTSVFTGYKETEGTASTEVYHFSDSKGNEVIYEPYVPDGSKPQLEFIKQDSSSVSIPVHNGYWLDLRQKI